MKTTQMTGTVKMNGKEITVLGQDNGGCWCSPEQVRATTLAAKYGGMATELFPGLWFVVMA